MTPATRITLQAALRMLCALALLFAGLVHRPPAASAHPLPPLELSQYVLPDGSLPVLCLPSQDDHQGHSGHEAPGPCEACRLAGAVILPAPADLEGRPLPRMVERLRPPLVAPDHRQPFEPNTAPRGPPSGSEA